MAGFQAAPPEGRLAVNACRYGAHGLNDISYELIKMVHMGTNAWPGSVAESQDTVPHFLGFLQRHTVTWMANSKARRNETSHVVQYFMLGFTFEHQSLLAGSQQYAK